MIDSFVIKTFTIIKVWAIYEDKIGFINKLEPEHNNIESNEWINIESIEWIDNGSKIMLWWYKCKSNDKKEIPDRNYSENKCHIQVSIDCLMKLKFNINYILLIM